MCTEGVTPHSLHKAVLPLLCAGCWAALFPVILVDLLGIEVIEKSLGQCLAAGSVAFLVASPMSGE